MTLDKIPALSYNFKKAIGKDCDGKKTPRPPLRESAKETRERLRGESRWAVRRG